MRTLTYQKAARAELLDELVAALGLPATDLVVSPGDATTTVGVPDGVDPAAVDAVVAAHDPAVYAAKEADRRQLVLLALGVARNFRSIPSGTATATQRDNMAKALFLLLGEVYQEARDD